MNFTIIKMVITYLIIYFHLVHANIIVQILNFISDYMISWHLFFQKILQSYLVESHHIFNLIFSIFAVFGVYQITKRLFSRSIGKIAFIVCFFNPVYFGHFSINPKDTIIAFCYIWIFNISLKYIYNV